MEAFSELKAPAFVFDLQDINGQLHKLAESESGHTDADRQLVKFYESDSPSFVWLNRHGVDLRADTLLSWLHKVRELGMSEKAFCVEAIESDLSRMRSLSFDDSQNSINHVAARLEYHLTKAYLRYATGSQYGFVNPHKVFNNLDASKKDTLGNVLEYKGLFDVEMEHPSEATFRNMLRKAGSDSLIGYLHEVQPQGNYYRQLKSMLASAATAEQRKRIMVNMERTRWRRRQPIAERGKRIIVNIPAYHLYAHSDQETLDMRIACGALSTKTPQLSSNIEYMEVNPQWVIPMSIVQADVAHRAGDSSYFARHRYNIYDRATNKQVGIHQVSRQMLLSGKYRVAQAGGAGNSLGRIVFRFKNNFSVFLHDTSTPSAFSRDSRAVSHGCVRVSKPFDLARFVLDNPDEWLLDRIRISMGLAPETERGQQYIENNGEGHHKLIGYVPVKPHVPLYIIYNTLWPDENGILQTWPDVYGYDEVLWRSLQPYM